MCCSYIFKEVNQNIVPQSVCTRVLSRRSDHLTLDSLPHIFCFERRSGTATRYYYSLATLSCFPPLPSLPSHPTPTKPSNLIRTDSKASVNKLTKRHVVETALMHGYCLLMVMRERGGERERDFPCEYVCRTYFWKKKGNRIPIHVHTTVSMRAHICASLCVYILGV